MVAQIERLLNKFLDISLYKSCCNFEFLNDPTDRPKSDRNR